MKFYILPLLLLSYFVNFFLMFQSEALIFLVSVLLLFSIFSSKLKINLNQHMIDRAHWVETIRFYILFKCWMNSFIRINYLKRVKLIKAFVFLKKELQLLLSDIIQVSRFNNQLELLKYQTQKLSLLEDLLKEILISQELRKFSESLKFIEL